MSYKPEFSTAWLNDPDIAYKVIIRKIIKGLTGNADFTELNPSIKDVETQFNIYDKYVLEPGEYTTSNSRERIKERETLTGMLKLMILDAASIAKFDLAKMTSTGIPMVKLPSEAPTPEIPTDIKMYISYNPLKLTVTCKSQVNASTYKARISEDEKNWKWNQSNRGVTNEFLDLPRGKKLYLQMCMKNTNGESEWSQSIPFMIAEEGVLIPAVKKVRKKAKKK